jgi:hypothetical protein
MEQDSSLLLNMSKNSISGTLAAHTYPTLGCVIDGVDELDRGNFGRIL